MRSPLVEAGSATTRKASPKATEGDEKSSDALLIGDRHRLVPPYRLLVV